MTEDKKNLKNPTGAKKPEEKSKAQKESAPDKIAQKAKANQQAKGNQPDKEKQQNKGNQQEKPPQKENPKKTSEAPKASQKEASGSKEKGSQTATAEPAIEQKSTDKSTNEQKAIADKATTEGKSSEKASAELAIEKKASDKSSEKKSPEKATAEQKVADKSTDKTTTELKTKKASTDKSTEKAPAKKNTVKLQGLFAFKMSMSTFYNKEGQSIPVTALKYEPCFVSQVKTEKKDNYSAIQMAFIPQKNKRCSKALIQHLKSAGFKEAARFVKEIRQEILETLKVGQEVDIESLKKGDLLKVSSVSKGRGFTGVMKRWNFAGGKASHGSKTHRRTGSIGQHTEPARVFPGRKMPGRHGFKKVSLSKVPVVEVFPNEGIIFIKGPVPGARNTLVSLQKMN